jgi:hypothetical protein
MLMRHEGHEVGRKKTIVHGKPDEVSFRSTDKDKVAATVEIKSSHNLLVPNNFELLKERYETAFTSQILNKKTARSQHWSQIGHPFAQLFGYMVDNRTRFGALCSASKTYFVFVDLDGELRVTNAWLTVDRSFIKAWASFLRLADEYTYHDRFTLPTTWLKGTPIRTGGNDDAVEDDDDDDDLDDNGCDGGGDPSNKQNTFVGKLRSKLSRAKRTNRSSSQKQSKKPCSKTTKKTRNAVEGKECALVLHEPPPLHRVETPDHWPHFKFENDFVPFIEFATLTVGDPLGSGRNGDVFEATLPSGESVAVKQFDMTKNFKSYEREVCAYKRLKNVWGELVPTPKLISASPSGNVRYLGMTLGDTPEGGAGEDEYLEKIHILETCHKFRHLDVWSGGYNYILVPPGNVGSKKVLVTDLEAWEEAK